ncbi:MAG TPA: GAF domain-containing protein [Candidatus Polarisedimenticolia bacterium]|nr:GAF domain-containing protein [Candidatus Polarisedimenticolia bacterium]
MNDDPRFDETAQLAAAICAAPLAWVAFPDRDRLRIRARVGPRFPDPPRGFGFCALVVDRREPIVVENAGADLRAAGNAALEAPLYLRFYAGAPILTSEGGALGTVAVADVVPRRLEPWQRDGLERLARLLSLSIEERAASRERERRRGEALASLAGSLASELQGIAAGAPARSSAAPALLRQLLALAGHRSLRPQPIDVNRLVERLSAAVSAADPSWALALDPGLGSAQGDEERIGRVIGGLARRAADGGAVRIATSGRILAGSEAILPPGEYVMVTIDPHETPAAGEAASADAQEAERSLSEWCFDPADTFGPGAGASEDLLEASGLLIQSGGRLGVSRTPRRSSFCLALPRARAEA